MSSGGMPEYSYRPIQAGTAKMRSVSSRRARLWAGGTYFRARDPGGSGNLLTVEVFKYTDDEAYCRITNTGLLYSENVTGAECKVDLLELDSKTSGEYEDLYEIYDLDTTQPRARKYSISLRIKFARQNGSTSLPAPEELGSFQFGKLFTSGKLSVQLTKKAAPYTAQDRIFIAPRSKTFALSKHVVVVTPPDDGSGTPPTSTTYTGYNIASLRSAVNAANIWVEMKPRTAIPAVPEGGSMPDITYIDAQDTRQDDPVLMPFNVVNLANGDGLPENPDREKTGPTRAIVHVNYGEKDDGTLGVVSKVYEWAGDSSSAGSWKTY